MAEIKEKLTNFYPATRQGWLALAWFLVLAAVHFYLVSYHSFWRDEIEAWVTVSGMNSFWDSLFVPMHPPLWYMVLYAAHAVWPDPQMLSVLGSAIALGCCAALMGTTRISLLLRVLISLNFYFLWQYTIVVRGYSLMLLLLLLWLSLKDEQHEKPASAAIQLAHGVFLALMALVHVYAIILMPLLYIWRYGVSFPLWRAVPAVVGCISSVFIVWWSYPHFISPAGLGEATSAVYYLFDISYVLLRPVLFQLVMTMPVFMLPILAIGLLSLLGWLMGVAVPKQLSKYASLQRKLQVLSVPLGLLALAVIIQKGSAALWHVGFIWLAVVALLCLYAQRVTSREAKHTIHTIALIMSLTTFPFVFSIGSQLYSAAQLAAQQIEQRGLEQQTWVAIPAWAGTAPFAYLQRPYFALEHMQDITYTNWTAYWQREQQLGAASMADRIEKLCIYALSKKLGKINVIAPYKLYTQEIEPEIVAQGLRAELVWQSPAVLADDEDTSLFVVDATLCPAHSRNLER
jgi:hypothetical protein